MSRFNPKGYERSPEDWEIEAIKSTDDGNLHLVVFGGFLLAVGGWVASPLLGLTLGAGVVLYMRSRIQNSGREQELIQTYGCVAHALNQSDFLAYKLQVGNEEVFAQLQFAHQHGFPIKSAGLDFLESHQHQLPVNASIVDTQRSIPTPLSPSGFGSPYLLEQQDQAALPPLSANNTVTEVVTNQPEEVPDLAREIADRLKPTLIIGVPGAGKDILCWNAVELIKQSKAKVIVFCIDPKGDPKERPYFEGRVDRLYSLDFNAYPAQKCFEFITQALQDYEDYDSQGSTKLLIFNELNATTKTLKQVKGGMGFLEKKLTFYSSSGRSRGWVIWAISQTAHEKGLGFGGETRPIFIKIVLITLDNPDAAVDILRAQIIAKEQKIPPQALKEICDRSPVGVAVYHGSLQKWFPQVKMRDFIAEANSQVAV